MNLSNLLSRFLPWLIMAIYVLLTSYGAFTGGVWAAVGIAGALILFFGTWVKDRKMPRPDPCWAGMAVLTLLVMASLNFYSSDPAVSWFEWRRLAGVFLPLMLLSCPALAAKGAPKYLFPVMTVGASICCTALALELYLGVPVLQKIKGFAANPAEYNRGFSHVVILTFPIMAGLWVTGRKSWIVPFVIILLFPASLTESRAAKLALITGVPVALLASRWPNLTRKGLMTASVLLIAWPFATQYLFKEHEDFVHRIPASWQNRIEIWDYMSYRIEEKPLLGWGLGTSRELDFRTPHGERYLWVRNVPAPHPHNVVTQLWVELGVPGLALGLIFVALTLQKMGSLPPRLAPFAAGAWAAGLCLSLVAYNFWTDSLFAAFALAGFLFILLKYHEENESDLRWKQF